MRLQVVELPRSTVGEVSDRGCLLIFDEVDDHEVFGGANLSDFKAESGIAGVLVFEDTVEVVR